MAIEEDMAAEPQPGALVKRHRISTRLWHWTNAIAIIVLLMSGLSIFNAHPRLYWGSYGANPDTPWLQISNEGNRGYLQIGETQITTTGVLGRWREPDGDISTRAFPHWATIPGYYSLAAGRLWHFFFAWIFVLSGLAYWAWSFGNRHIQRDLKPSRKELSPKHIWNDIASHARLRFPTGAAALKYNILQKLSYLIVLFVLLPLIVLTGLTMSPMMDTAWPWLLDLFGGRQSARSIHFIVAFLIVLFIVVHLAMVVLAGPFNEVRSMITGKFRLPKARGDARPLRPEFAEEQAQ
ncbi:cytochrome b/b6 domain-containing protein [Parasphingopyxis lamellibrachiae]|uniref:Thiosulfate reductase cytochrome b subunit n=1 Tax=Parasphingopyxis lamellibrachiae TaxID=680125 RepID=A0A3D9FEY4_9SPHN|nr:cytochrome b/b6 domain-containing protein [Parasphingopyxis lamellibrachiae]RED16218.1 thiosulfate reductase cytochrome b subunit [Parasphingopyxis lamellibrachiae]